MTIADYKKECKDNALAVFDVVNESGEVMDDTFAIIGFDSQNDITDRIDFIHFHYPKFTGTLVLYEQLSEEQMKHLGTLIKALNKLEGKKEFTYGDTTFDIGSRHFAPGILIR